MLSLRQFGAHLKNAKTPLIFGVLLFAVGIALGMMNAEALQQVVIGQIEGLRETSQRLAKNPNPEFSFFLFIFFNNAIKGVLMIYLGMFAGIIPAFFLIINGMVLGYLIELQSVQGASIADLVIRGLLPHGIIEIPAIIIASAIGMKFGLISLRRLGGALSGRSDRGQGEWRQFFKSTLNVSFWIVILLFIAAIIESTLTFHLMKS
ncbi:stage II sporulation protein M [Paenibacillus sp. J22TS3]|uniref:stage II sporulation protein M n=1 Tax=Paenibacillus sp. J22TS3 TaxID=2807192 RepID=UPI001B064421|nr:stage II sporulation protein M [Paenibacillus sp. J22TS3]GIP24717.1 hypothetical protein J22TS3_49920 [Paenibacillus sp. J22TS3]